MSAPDPVFVLRGAQAPVMAITFMAPQPTKIQRIAAGTQLGTVIIWNLKTSSIEVEWAGHPGSSVVWVCCVEADRLWTQGRHHAVRCWDVTTRPPTALAEYPMSDYLGFGQCNLAHVAGNYLIAIPGPGQLAVSVWDTKTTNKICSLEPHDHKSRGSLMQALWVDVAGGQQLLCVYESGHVCLWDWNKNCVISVIQVTENPICVTFHKELQTGIIGTAGEKVFIFKIDDQLNITVLKEINITNAGVASCAVRQDGKLFVMGGWDSRIRIFSSKKCKALAVLQYHKKTVECVTYSSCQVDNYQPAHLLAAGSSDHSISLWDIY